MDVDDERIVASVVLQVMIAEGAKARQHGQRDQGRKQLECAPVGGGVCGERPAFTVEISVSPSPTAHVFRGIDPANARGRQSPPDAGPPQVGRPIGARPARAVLRRAAPVAYGIDGRTPAMLCESRVAR
jgi:hypothetical protein